MSSARRRVDWSFGPGHGPVSGVLNAAVGALGITMWLWLAHANALWALFAGGCLTAAGAGVALWYDQHGKVIIYRAVCWLLAGFWAFWVLVDFHGWYLFGLWHIMGFWASPSSPWTWRAFIPLAVTALVVAFVGWAMARAERIEVERKDALAAERAEREAAKSAAEELARIPQNPEEEIGFRWEPYIRRITRNDITVLNIERWNPENGFTLDCQLPDDGTVLSDIKIYEEALAASAPEYPETGRDGKVRYQGLPDGCGVEIMPNPGMGRRNVLIKVTTVSALGQDIPYPMDQLGPENIENPISIGVETDRKVGYLPMRFETTVMVGNTDSGKSNQTNVFTTGLGRCTNVILVGIDLTGNGRLMRPWNRAHYQGRAARPVFGNVATTPRRARALCQSLLQIIDGRTADYAPMMAAANKDYLPVSPEVPLICLLVDEFKRLPRDVAEMVEDIVETGRGAAVRAIACSLEATASGIPKGVLKHARNRVGMRVVDEAELVYLFDATWKRSRFDPASMPWKGSGLYTTGPQAPKKFKGYRIDPAQVDAISIRLAEYRPELDAPSLARGDTVTVREIHDDVPVEVTYEGVWSNWEADTYPAMFAGMEGGASTGVAAHSGGTATITRRDTTMTTPSTGDPSADFQASYGRLTNAVGDMDDAMNELAAQANGEKPVDKSDSTATGDDPDAEGDDGPRTAGAGPRTPTVAELVAMLAAPDAPDPIRPDTNKPPTGDPIAAKITPAGQGHAQGGPPAKTRILQLLYLAGDAGVRPGELHTVLAAEGYTTVLTTVQTTLKGWLARRFITQTEPREPYVRGPEFPTDRL